MSVSEINSPENIIEATLDLSDLPSSASYFRIAFTKSDTNPSYFGKMKNDKDDWVEIGPLGDCDNYYRMDELNQDELVLRIKMGKEVESGTYFLRAHRLTETGCSPTPTNFISIVYTPLPTAILLLPTPTEPSGETTNIPTPTNTPEPFSITANFNSSVSAGEEFDVSVEIQNDESETEYYLKARIGEDTSELTRGETYSSESNSWLTDGSAWTEFPKFTTTDGSWSGSVKAKVKNDSSAGDYYLVVRVREVDGGNKDSVEYQLTVSSPSSPTSTPTPNPTTKPSSTPKPTATKKPSPTLKPSPTFEATPSGDIVFSTASAGKILGEFGEATESGEGDEKKQKTTNRIVAGILIVLGGGLISVVGFAPKIKEFLENRKVRHGE